MLRWVDASFGLLAIALLSCPTATALSSAAELDLATRDPVSLAGDLTVEFAGGGLRSVESPAVHVTDIVGASGIVTIAQWTRLNTNEVGEERTSEAQTQSYALQNATIHLVTHASSDMGVRIVSG